MRITSLLPIPGVRIPLPDANIRSRPVVLKFVDVETDCVVEEIHTHIAEDLTALDEIRIRAIHYSDINHHTIYGYSDEGDEVVITPLCGEALSE